MLFHERQFRQQFRRAVDGVRGTDATRLPPRRKIGVGQSGVPCLGLLRNETWMLNAMSNNSQRWSLGWSPLGFFMYPRALSSLKEVSRRVPPLRAGADRLLDNRLMGSYRPDPLQGPRPSGDDNFSRPTDSRRRLLDCGRLEYGRHHFGLDCGAGEERISRDCQAWEQIGGIYQHQIKADQQGDHGHRRLDMAKHAKKINNTL